MTQQHTGRLIDELTITVISVENPTKTNNAEIVSSGTKISQERKPIPNRKVNADP
jgi:hypothetical protein